MERYSLVIPESPVGGIRIVTTATHLIEISLGRFEQGKSNPSVLTKTVANELKEYFLGERTVFSVPISMEGTPFQKSVWRALQNIPFGETVTYGELATKVNRPQAYRAVGTAVGKNPIGIIVPCHRVVAAHGIGGYASGVDHKKALMRIEHISF